MSKNYIKIICILLLSLVLFNYNLDVDATEKIKVLLIENNPILYSITDNNLYKNNDGHPKVSEYFSQSVDDTINEFKNDLEYTSHNYIDIEIVDRKFLNEFPKYTQQITLKNGTKAYMLDEETYLYKSGYDGSTRGSWWNLYNSGLFDEIPNYIYDYDYVFNKYDLIEKKKRGEFDQVWIVSIDPTKNYETIMVGKNAFWVNSPAYLADCNNFQVVNLSISRRDANLHAFNHGVESVLNAAFSRGYEMYNAYANRGKYKHYYTLNMPYKENVVSIDESSYNDLNLWEKYSLGVYGNTLGYSSVGNVHFPFNADSGYDYTNTNKVLTNWRDWLNYPNISENFVLDNNNAWLNNAGNNELSSSENKAPDRLYNRFWLYLMPHIEGYSYDGHHNNWWEYIRTLDFVTDIKSNIGDYIDVKQGDIIDLNYTLTYNSGKTEVVKDGKIYENVHLTNNNVVVKDNKLIADKVGDCIISVYRDNKYISYNVKIDATPTTTTTTTTTATTTTLNPTTVIPSSVITSKNTEVITRQREENPQTGFNNLLSLCAVLMFAVVVIVYCAIKDKNNFNKFN